MIPAGENADGQARAHRRLTALAGGIVVILLPSGLLRTRASGGTHAHGLSALGYGAGVVVAVVLLAIGYEPPRRKR